MRKLLAVTLGMALLACNERPKPMPLPAAHSQKGDVPRMTNIGQKTDRRLQLAAFNPIIEEISGQPAVDPERVEFLDPRIQKERCQVKFAQACYDTDGGGVLMEDSWGTVPTLTPRNPRDAEKTKENIDLLNTYVHEQGHGADQKLEQELKFRALDELEARVFTLVFDQRLAKIRPWLGSNALWMELAFLYSIPERMDTLGHFQNFDGLVDTYQRYVEAKNGEELERLREYAPHNIGDVVFALLIDWFEYDLERMYQWIHQRPSEYVEKLVNQAIAHSEPRAHAEWAIQNFKKKMQQEVPYDPWACENPDILSSECSMADPPASEILADPERFLLSRKNEDVWKLEARMRRNPRIRQRVLELYRGAYDQLEQAVQGSAWTFRATPPNEKGEYRVYGRNERLFCKLYYHGNVLYEIQLKHRYRNAQGMDLEFHPRRIGRLIKFDKTEKDIWMKEDMGLEQNTPYRNYAPVFGRIQVNLDRHWDTAEYHLYIAQSDLRLQMGSASIPFQFNRKYYEKLRGLAMNVAEMARRQQGE